MKGLAGDTFFFIAKYCIFSVSGLPDNDWLQKLFDKIFDFLKKSSLQHTVILVFRDYRIMIDCKNCLTKFLIFWKIFLAKYCIFSFLGLPDNDWLQKLFDNFFFENILSLQKLLRSCYFKKSPFHCTWVSENRNTPSLSPSAVFLVMAFKSSRHSFSPYALLSSTW